MQALTTRPDAAPELTDIPAAAVAPNELRVRIAAATVNPIDNFFAIPDGREAFGLPAVVGLGWDISGVVDEVGAEVSGFAPGDRVAALDTNLSAPSRGHAENIVVPTEAAAKVPEGLDLVQAASIPMNATTAAQALDLLGPAAGRSLLITGAAGAVGGYAVALAARAGWQVSGLARTADEQFVRAAGAQKLITELSGPEFDAVLDAAALQEAALTAVRDGGAFVGVMPPAPVTPERGITVSTQRVHHDPDKLAQLLDLSRTGDLAVRVAGTAPLADAATAYQQVAAGGQRGRWLLIP